MKKICVYCGSSSGKSRNYIDAARDLGRELVARGIDLVYGGASVGVMGEIADEVLAAGGKVTGVIPRSLANNEISHQGLTELKIVESMHERKATMTDISDGFIALPGGLGTLEELFEVLTWSQLGFHHKPCALLNVKQYYDTLLQFLDHATHEEFVKLAHRKMLLIEDKPSKLLNAMSKYKSPVSEK